MTDLHALETTADGVTRVVVHVVVPNETLPGAGGRSLRACIANTLPREPDGTTLSPVSVLKAGAGTPADPGTITSAEATALANGSLLEAVRYVTFPTPSTDAANAAYMDGEYPVIAAEELDRQRARHAHTGKTRDVPGQGA